MNSLRRELLKKDQEIQSVVLHLNRAEEFIASNEAVFMKAEQEKVAMGFKIQEL